jgi:hypothetical protein
MVWWYDVNLTYSMYTGLGEIETVHAENVDTVVLGLRVSTVHTAVWHIRSKITRVGRICARVARVSTCYLALSTFSLTPGLLETVFDFRSYAARSCMSQTPVVFVSFSIVCANMLSICTSAYQLCSIRNWLQASRYSLCFRYIDVVVASQRSSSKLQGSQHEALKQKTSEEQSVV